ncbi:hypothetical protein ACLB1M_29740 [Escherichia coli]
MGAGRTELMKVLYGALPRTSGYVTLDGHEVVTRSPQDALQAALCISPKTVNVTV